MSSVMRLTDAIDDVTSFVSSRPGAVGAALAGSVLGLGIVWLAMRRRRKDRTGETVASVQEICIYPVKSCQPMSLKSAKVEKRGFRFDRRWVVVDTWSKHIQSGTAGAFLTLKQQPKLALIFPTVEELGDGTIVLKLRTPDMDELQVRHPLPGHADEAASAKSPVRLSMYQMDGEGLDCGDEAADWLHRVTDMPGARLLYMPDNDVKDRRLADSPQWGGVGGENTTAYANFSPYMMANKQSLVDLNRRLTQPEKVDMRCFRPNIVVQGEGAWSEDTWRVFTIGNVSFQFLKKCGRCPMTTLDPNTGRRLGEEPLRTLKKFRLDTSDERYGQSPCFGVNLAAVSEGSVSVGDKLVLVSPALPTLQ